MQVETRSRGSQLFDAALWAASLGLFVLSLVFSWGPPPPSPNVSWFDKVWHGLGYGALTGTLLLAAVWRPGRGPGRFPRTGLRVALLVLALAWLTEVLQAPFGRDASPTDGLVDFIGVAVALAAWKLAILHSTSPAST